MALKLLKKLVYSCICLGAAWLCAELAFLLFRSPISETTPITRKIASIPALQTNISQSTYDAILKRNLFHVPVEPGESHDKTLSGDNGGTDAETALLDAEMDKLPISKQGWTLLGTVVNTLNPRKNRAILEIDNKQAAHGIGNEIKGWKLIHIDRRCVVVARNGRRERMLVGGKEISLPAPQANSTRGSLKGQDIEKALQNIPDLLTQAGFEPGQHNGLMGLNLTFVKPDSIFAKLGLKTNDLLLQANGQTLTSLGDLARLANIAKEDTLHVELMRNGENVVLEYEIKR